MEFYSPVTTANCEMIPWLGKIDDLGLLFGQYEIYKKNSFMRIEIKYTSHEG